jgi:transcription termination factor Rho
MGEFGVGAVVDHRGDLEREQAAGGGVGSGVREREGDPLVVVDPLAALLAGRGPIDGLIEQPPHRADPASGNPEPLLAEPGALELIAPADLPEFEQMTPILPKRRLGLDLEPSDVLTRAADLLAPLAFGQRVLVMTAPRSGRTMLLRGIARAVRGVEGPELIVLLVDERPEEATAWREALPGAQLATATAELAPAEQVRVAELALERARRRAEAGADVVLIVDSLSRLAVASGQAAEIKRLFGSGRDLAEEGAGSLTVIATVVAGAEDDGAAERAVMTTESSLIRLDPELAAAGVVPALSAAECRVSNEEELREPEELAAVRRLRALLADLAPVEAATLLRERIESTQTNAELLAGL